jgi:cyclic pyranopterin phosphate synthase
MVDVSGKLVTVRRARAHGRVLLRPGTIARISSATLPKGEALEAARLAGILAAKRTATLIPLCHPLPVDWIDVRIELAEGAALIEAEVKTHAATGAEMEALVAVSVAALTLYDMVKSVEPGAVITDIAVVEKSGGKSGRWLRKETPK